MNRKTAIHVRVPATTTAAAPRMYFSTGLMVRQKQRITCLTRWSVCFVVDHWAISAASAVRLACSASALASELGHWQAFGFRSAVGSAGARRA